MIKQFVTSDFCLKCYGCCRFGQKHSVWIPHLLNKDIKNIFKRKSYRSFISPRKTIVLQHLLTQRLFVCPFLNLKSNKCKIYKMRPFDCRLYPFLINRKGKNIFLAAHRRCPYIKENLKSEKFKKYVRYLADFLNTSSYRTLLKRNPRIINKKYSESINLLGLKL